MLLTVLEQKADDVLVERSFHFRVDVGADASAAESPLAAAAVDAAAAPSRLCITALVNLRCVSK
jgi:hypothetical protein